MAEPIQVIKILLGGRILDFSLLIPTSDKYLSVLEIIFSSNESVGVTNINKLPKSSGFLEDGVLPVIVSPN